MSSAPAPVQTCTVAEFQRRFDSDVRALPSNLFLIGWSGPERCWYVGGRLEGASAVRVQHLLAFLGPNLPSVFDGRTSWFICCPWDGWRERVAYTDQYRWVDPPAGGGDFEWKGDPGVLPRYSEQRPEVVCFAAHRGDPSAVVVPEAHWLKHGGYRRLFLRTALSDRPRGRKRPSAVYAGSDHGEAVSVIGNRAGASARRLLAQEAEGHPNVEVHLGGGVPRREQLAHRLVIDVDGFTRTWDAFAWKLSSRSTLLSHTSTWDTWFTRQFRAGEHFVALANDVSDLRAQVDWCLANEPECAAISRRARAQVRAVYRRSTVVDGLRPVLEDLLHRSR